jgi:hypothetical protein
VRRREMVILWMDATLGLGRSPDFMNIFLTGLASAADTFGGKDWRFADDLRAYRAVVRDDDLCLTHTLVMVFTQFPPRHQWRAGAAGSFWKILPVDGGEKGGRSCPPQGGSRGRERLDDP